MTYTPDTTPSSLKKYFQIKKGLWKSLLLDLYDKAQTPLVWQEIYLSMQRNLSKYSHTFDETAVDF